MREILFKAKRMDNGEWIEGTPIKTHIGTFIVFEENPHYCSQYEYMEIDGLCKVNSDTISQYISLTDKDGNKIWENDIVKCVYDGKTYIYVVIWDKDELNFKATNGKENYSKNFVYLGCCEELEIIGNIFENIELLRGE